MSDFLDVFGSHNYLVRESLVLVFVALGVYVLFRAGIFAVPQIGFMAIAAYTAAVLNTRYGAPLLVSVTTAATLAALVGLLLGWLLRKLDGIHLAIATIGFSEIVRLVIRNLEITKGPLGIAGVERSLTDVQLVLLVVVAVAALWRLGQTRFGTAMAGLHDDPLVAAHQGVGISNYRIGLFGLSGLLAGLGGGLYPHLTGFVYPDLFGFQELIAAVATVVLGGMTSPIGPLLGGVIIRGMPAVLVGFAEYRDLINGVVIIVVIGLAPEGLVGLGHKLLASRRDPKTFSEQGHHPSGRDYGQLFSLESTDLR